MTMSEAQIEELKSFGFKARSKKRFSYLNAFNQFLTVNVLENDFQLEIDGRRLYGTSLTFKDVIKIITILYPHESRQRI